MRRSVLAFLSGALFAGGLVLSGMTQPAKVIAFLDVFGNWDPSLAFVMVGAIAVYAPTYRWLKRTRFHFRSLATPTAIDFRLLFGAALFGIGWGIAGICPGPAIASSSAGVSSVLLFTSSMIVGMLFANRLLIVRTQVTSENVNSDG